MCGARSVLPGGGGEKQLICLSGVCVSPLLSCLPTETGFCPPPAQPELRIPAGRAGTAAGRFTCGTGTAVPVRQQAGLLAVPARPAGGRLRALVSIHYTAEESARV